MSPEIAKHRTGMQLGVTHSFSARMGMTLNFPFPETMSRVTIEGVEQALLVSAWPRVVRCNGAYFCAFSFNSVVSVYWVVHFPAHRICFFGQCQTGCQDRLREMT